MSKPNRIWNRNSSDGKATFSVTRFSDLKMILASVDLIGYEITCRYYDIKNPFDAIAIKNEAITYAESAWELYEKLSEIGLMDHLDFGDKLFDEE